MARIVLPEVTNEEEGYEQPLDPGQDALAAAGFYPQEPNTTVFDADVGIERSGGELVLKDTVAGTKLLKDLAGGGAAQIINYLPEGPALSSFKEIVGGTFPTQIIWWTDETKTKKIYEEVITRAANKNPTTVVYRTYAADGVTASSTVTETITYQGAQEVSRSRVYS